MRKARRPAAIAMALALALQLGTVVPAAAAGINSTAGYENGNSPLNLNLIARYASGQYNVDGGVMEIVAYSQSNGYAYAINGQSGLLAAIPLGDLTAGISVARLSGTDIEAQRHGHRREGPGGGGGQLIPLWGHDLRGHLSGQHHLGRRPPGGGIS